MRTITIASLLCSCVIGWGQSKPEFASSNAVSNAGGGNSEYAPGSLIYVRGSYLTEKAGIAAAPYPETLNGTSVSVTQSGVTLSAPLLEALPDRLTVQLPYGLKKGSSTLKVKTAGGELLRNLNIVETAPRPIYRQAGSTWIAEAYHSDGLGVTDASPAKPGEEIKLIVQGLGETTPEIKAGALPGDGSEERPFHVATAEVAATLGTTELEVKSARLAVGRPGIYEVTVVTPADVTAGVYPVSAGVKDSPLSYGGTLPAGWRIVQLTKVWNTEACETTEKAALRLPDDAVITKIETWYKFPEEAASLPFTVMNAAGEEVFASTMTKRTCDEANPEWCLASRLNMRQELPAGEYQLVTAEPGLCVNAVTAGQAFVKLYGVWKPSNWQVASDGWVTPEGGTFEAPGFKLTAEAGALADAANLIVSTTVRPKDPEGDRITPYFRLEGLPTALAAPVTITLDVPGAPDGEVTLLMQPEENDDAPALLPGLVQDGKLRVSLPVRQVAEKTATRAASERAGALSNNSKVSWMLWAMAGLKPNTSRDEHFIIHAPSSASELTKKIGNDLEDAYKLIESMGLDWKKRGGTPIEVYLFSYNSWSSLVLGGSGNAAGNSETGIWGKNNVGLCINLDTLQSGSQKELDDARITAGHELLHIMQAQYEGSSSGWLWLEEATATWLERALSSDADYISGNTKENMYFLYTDPLEVASWWGRESARRHGYGASLFLQTMAPAAPNSVDSRVGSVLKLMESDPAIMPLEALEKVFGVLNEPWWEFCDRYLGGTISTGFPLYGDLTGGAVKPITWQISKSTTTSREKFAHPHLGARLYQVTFDLANQPAWPEQAKLRFTLTSQGLAKAFVYTMRGPNITKAGEFMGMFDLENVKELAEAKGRVFVMVSNGTHIYPNNGTTDIQLEVKLDGEFKGTNSLEHSFHGVLYNKYYELDFEARVEGTAPFQIYNSAEAFGCCFMADLITPPIDLKTLKPGEDQVDEYTVTVTYKNLKPGPSAPGGWKAGMRVKAGFDLKEAMSFGPATMSKTYKVTRGGKSVSSGFMTEVFWPDTGSLQGGADTPVSVSFTPQK